MDSNTLLTSLKLAQLIQNQSPESQIGALALLVKQFGRVFHLNETQAAVVHDLLVNKDVFLDNGTINEQLISQALTTISEAATPPPCLRVICKNCGSLNKIS